MWNKTRRPGQSCARGGLQTLARPQRQIFARGSFVRLASSLARGAEFERAEALYQEGMRELPKDPLFALQRIACLQNGTEIVLETGDIDQATSRAEEAQRVLRASPFDSDVLEMHTWTDLAKVYGAAGMNTKAVASYEKSAALLTALGRDQTGTAFTLFNNWALQLNQMGRPLEAETLFRRALAIGKTGEGDTVQSPVVLTNYAHSLRELGRSNEAAKYAERGYADSKRVGIEINHSLLERATDLYRARKVRPGRSDVGGSGAKVEKDFAGGTFCVCGAGV